MSKRDAGAAHAEPLRKHIDWRDAVLIAFALILLLLLAGAAIKYKITSGEEYDAALEKYNASRLSAADARSAQAAPMVLQLAAGPSAPLESMEARHAQ